MLYKAPCPPRYPAIKRECQQTTACGVPTSYSRGHKQTRTMSPSSTSSTPTRTSAELFWQGSYTPTASPTFTRSLSSQVALIEDSQLNWTSMENTPTSSLSDINATAWTLLNTAKREINGLRSERWIQKTRDAIRRIFFLLLASATPLETYSISATVRTFLFSLPNPHGISWAEHGQRLGGWENTTTDSLIVEIFWILTTQTTSHQPLSSSLDLLAVENRPGR